jgi:hypothetical protein
MRVTIDLPSGKLLASEVGEAQEACARDLLGRLAARASTLAPGETVSVYVGWATLRLSASSQLVVAEEPDYLNNPARFISSLMITCRVFDAQRQLREMLNIVEQPVSAQEYVRVSNDAMQAVSVVGYRHAENEEPFTGWQVVSTAPPEEIKWGFIP